VIPKAKAPAGSKPKPSLKDQQPKAEAHKTSSTPKAKAADSGKDVSKFASGPKVMKGGKKKPEEESKAEANNTKAAEESK